MFSRTINEPRELQTYANEFFRRTSVLLPEPYLRQGTTVGWFNGSDTMVGGYTIATRPPYRVLGVVPEARHDDFLRVALQHDDVAEANGVWLAEEYHDTGDATRFMRDVICSVAHCGKACILFGYNPDNERVARLYRNQRVGLTVLLEGAIELPHGLISISNVCLGYVKSADIQRAFFPYELGAPRANAREGAIARGQASASRG